MVNLAQASGVNIPLTFFSDESSLDEINDKIRYPSIIKPLYSQYNLNTKCDVINDEEDLNKSIKKDRYRAGYVIQEVIEGKEDKIWVCGGYCNSNTDFLALFTGHKYRQLPKLFGSTTVAVSQRNTAVMEMAMTFLKHIGYHGCFSFEAKQQGDEYKFIETNFRICFWNEMVISSGINLPYIAYCDAVGLPCERDIEQKDGIIWISILDDFITCFKYYSRDNKFVFIDWIKKVFRANSYADFRLTDIVPFLVKMLRSLLKMRY
jgi:predicted ATP-grasp superfamily ATP-dependent carboligase